MTDYSAWVRDGQYVEARYASYDGVHARGWVYAYSDKPTVHLVQADGADFTWNAELCAPVGDASDEARRAALALRGRVTGSVPYLESEVAYWRERAEALERKIQELPKIASLLPPEPPIGTVYIDEHGAKGWERREDGWHCARGCRNCPCDWLEAWDMGIRRGGGTRRLP
jgi:hypothetical protein